MVLPLDGESVMKKVQVLIVNDHPVLREGLHQVLAQSPEIEVLASIPSNYHLHQQIDLLHPDLLILDTRAQVPLQQIVAECRVARPNQRIVLSTALAGLDEKRLVERLQVDALVSVMDDSQHLIDTLLSTAAGQHPVAIDAAVKEELDKFRSDVNGKLDHPLSPREVDVLCCVAQAMTAKEIASDLRISVKTVDRHKANIMNKLNMRSQIELARFAIRHGFVEA